VLNYVVTSNHVHLLVRDTGEGIIAHSMQLVAARTAQEYNHRRSRHGAFCEDRYHATAIEADEHLHRCLVYIDLNMVRAGVVKRPAEWTHGGYQDLQEPPERYTLIQLAGLSALCGFTDVVDFQQAHRQWVAEALTRETGKRDARWSEAVAVGSEAFVERLKRELGMKAQHRDIDEADGAYALGEPGSAYTNDFGTESDALRPKNTIPGHEIL
jgi:putative transposase